MRILFAAYRDWAINVFDALSTMKSFSSHAFSLVKTPEELSQRTEALKWDVIVVVGWSWKVPSNIVNENIVIGMHPSDLPDFAGGSPIQNQIISGVESTNATLFRLNEKFDEGAIIDKDPISLRGHLDEVFESISRATLNLIIRFIRDYPNNKYVPQEKGGLSVKRLKPEDSRLPIPYIFVPDEIGEMHLTRLINVRELWNLIRCREDPYPNAYFEDETGRLTIKVVEFEPKDQK